MEHQRRADLMLLLATSFWGISNCLIAICLRDMQPVTLNAFRFLSAFAVLGAVFHKRVLRASRETWRYSVLVGLSLVAIYLGATYGEWSKALSVAEDIISNSSYKLWEPSEYVAAWSKSDANHSKEIMFEISINNNTDWTDREGIAYLYADKAGASPGYGDVIVTKDFSDMLTSDPADIRNDILLAAAAGGFDKRKVYINKMPAVNGDVRYSNVPLLRLSEVYLSAAEAAFQAGDKNKAANLLNDIISNRTTDESKQVTSGNITLDRIYIERRKELVGEGQRYFDVMRRGETVTRYTDVNDRGWHDVLSEEARTFNRDSKKALPLIPVGEINANPNIEQNPGY